MLIIMFNAEKRNRLYYYIFCVCFGYNLCILTCLRSQYQLIHYKRPLTNTNTLLLSYSDIKYPLCDMK